MRKPFGAVVGGSANVEHSKYVTESVVLFRAMPQLDMKTSGFVRHSEGGLFNDICK